LFPIVGKSKNDTYTYQGKNYKLPRHGFAREVPFELVKQTENTALFSLKNNAETLKMFPFEFELQMQYILSEYGLEIRYTVHNQSENTMPFSIGAHPAFAIDNTFSDYSLIFNENEKLISYQLENEEFNNSTSEIASKNGEIKLDYRLFEKDALVFKHLKSNQITLKNNDKFVFKIIFEGFPYLGIWTKQNAPFICIEPWCGMADNENHKGNIIKKEGIQLLEPAACFTRTLKIEL
jgi:galactose mutarotase-like enzyme